MHIRTISVYVGLNVIINRDNGAPTAGQSYSLTCTVILNGITGPPAIEWLSPNSSNVTVKNMVNDSTYERTLVFSSLHTSHGGQYTCQAVLGYAVASTELLVQSACVKSMSSQVTWFFVCFLFCFLLSVNVGALNAGGQISLPTINILKPTHLLHIVWKPG